MPDIQRIITITAQGGNSGPYYDVYWSNDCSTYTLATDGDNVYLPSVGSSVYVTMPDTACCIKLINLTPGCELNEVVLNFCPTTTTSTTLAPTTSTTTLTPTTTTTLSPTTTTIAPTTTTTLTPTTTTTQCPCVESVVLSVAQEGNVSFTDCLGVSRLTNVGMGLQTLDYAADGCIQYLTLAGTADFTIFSLGPCCSPLTTTTTTLAPTTTVAPTTTTTQCPCVETITLNVTEAGNVSFTDCLGVSRLTNVGTGIQTLDYAADGCIQINTLSGTAMFTIDAYGPCCSPVTTTTVAPTTTTLAPTTTIAPTTTVAPTTTTTQCACVESLILNVTVGGTFEFTDCCGTSRQTSVNAGEQQVDYGNDGCININTLAGTAEYTVISYGLCCTPTCPTTTTTVSPTTTTTVAPTTTTTIAPTTTTTFPPCVTSVSFEVDSAGDVRYVDCCGNTIYITFGIGPQVINDCLQYGSLFAVGASISFITYSSTACSCPPTTTTLAPTTTTLSPTTTTIAPTTTTVAPTTTTTLSPYDYYEADEYSCNPCTFQQSNVCVAFPAGDAVVLTNRYYRPQSITGFVYKNFTLLGSPCSPAIIMTTVGNSINCDNACGLTTTTTLSPTTTTLSPTTTIAPTTTTTEPPPAYNYYTFTSCTGGSTDYRSILSLALNDVYTFQAYPPDRACYYISDINAPVNTNDLPTIYGPLSGCEDANCIQL